MGELIIGKQVNRWQLFTSLLLIFSGAVIASKFDDWYAIVGGVAMATLGSYLNQAAIRWVTDNGNENSKLIIEE